MWRQKHTVGGYPANLIYVTQDAQGEPSQAYRALFRRYLTRGGALAPSFVVNYSRGNTDTDETIKAVASGLRVHHRALEGGVKRYLVGRPVKPAFRARN
jgi:glutamate-1-semialdehyde 2,1-aminomutase